MTKAELYELVDNLPEDTVAGTAALLKRIALRQLDPDQAWIWTEEWQGQIRQSAADVKHGRIQRYDSGEDLLAAL